MNAQQKTYDVNVESFTPLISPARIKEEIPFTDQCVETVLQGRRDIENIILGRDERLLIITGPCSIHDTKAALEYAEKLKDLQKKVKENILLVMRVYFEKPRTTIGWKGLINDPFLDSSYDVNEGLKKARSLLVEITSMGLPTGTEILDPITPQYIAGLLSWVAVGARTTESQTHREMASGLSMPVGFKNSTDGSLTAAFNAIKASASPQHFLGVDPYGSTAVVSTRGNKFGHLVLRGGNQPNYDPVSVGKAQDSLRSKGLPDGVIIDCSHDNSGKSFKQQPFVFKSVLEQRKEGNTKIIGMMLESNLFEGRQDGNRPANELAYGVSITDECIGWDTTSELILHAASQIH